ncbi:hypothetical protein M3Y99_00813500 [Aphelenchoides fujianensis]|nr:hypothetical protein M3Y99_00813500 [Aphelenchoides fujianensis]
MPELGVEISDFHDAQSVDCRLECTIVDQHAILVYKSVCEHWTFERAKRERWSVRVAASRLEAERKSGRLFADFRVDWKPPGCRNEEPVVLQSPSPAKMSAPTTFKMPLGDLQEAVKFQPHSFNGVFFGVRFFPPPHAGRPASFEFVIIRFNDRPFVRLHFEWTLRDAHQQPAAEHSETVDFNTCACGRPCSCPHKKTKARFVVDGETLSAAARPLLLELRVREVLGKPPGVPPHFEWSVAHGGFVDPKNLPTGDSASSASSLQRPHDSNPALAQPSSSFLPTARVHQFAPSPSFHLVQARALQASGTHDAASSFALNQQTVCVPQPPFFFAPLPRFAVPWSGYLQSVEISGATPPATYRLDVVDPREAIRNATRRIFENFRFVLFYHPPVAPEWTADFIFSLVGFPNGLTASLRLHWALLQTDDRPAFEHTAVRHFLNCGCRFSCECPQRQTATSYRLPAADFFPFAQANGLRLRLTVERWAEKPTAPPIREELTEIEEIPPPPPPPAVEVRDPSDRCPSPSGRRLWEARNRKRSAAVDAEVVCLSDDNAAVPPSNEKEATVSSAHQVAAELDQTPAKKKRGEGVVTIEAEGHSFVVDRQRLITESEFFAQAVAANVGADRFALDGITRAEMAAVCEWLERKRVDAPDLNALFLVVKRLGMPALKDACLEAIKRGCADEKAAVSALIFAVEEEDDELFHALSFLWDEQSKVAALLNSPQLMELLATRPSFSAKIYDVLFSQ